MTEFIKSKLEGKATEAPSIYAIQQGSAYLKVGDVGSSVVVCRELLNKKDMRATKQARPMILP